MGLLVHRGEAGRFGLRRTGGGGRRGGRRGGNGGGGIRGDGGGFSGHRDGSRITITRGDGRSGDDGAGRSTWLNRGREGTASMGGRVLPPRAEGMG